jgi:hypothetical protein
MNVKGLINSIFGKGNSEDSGKDTSVWVYINYPVSRITIHTDSNCPFVQNAKLNARRIKMVHSIKEAHNLLETVRFAANRDFNDLWLELDFGNREQKIKFAENEIKEILSKRYTPFGRATVNTHC